MIVPTSILSVANTPLPRWADRAMVKMGNIIKINVGYEDTASFHII